MCFWKRVWAVMRRELRIWERRPIYILGSVVVMAFMTVFFFTFFREGSPEKLPIAVVDLDNSSISRNFVQQLDATQLGKVEMFESYSDARPYLQRGDVTAICILPEGMMRDIQGFRQPRITFYVNGLYFIGGSLAYKDLQEMVNLTSGAVRREVYRTKGTNEYEIMGKIMPVSVDVHYIGSPGANIGNYLTNMLIPGMLELVIIIVFVYSMGAELKYGTSRHLLMVSGNIYTAIWGKMVVYTILFTLIGWTEQVIMYKWMNFPMSGNLGSMLLFMFLFVMACECVAVFIIGCVPVLRLGICIGALYSVLGISMCGFTLPVEVMPPFLQGIAYMYPLTFYYRAFVQEGIFMSGVPGWYIHAMILLGFQLIPFLVMPRLGAAYNNLNFPRK